jgi:hypothetical protein
MLSSIQSRQFKAGGSSAPLQLGLNPWSPYGNYFTGDLDQVVVYNRTLSASEVAALSAPPPAQQIAVSVAPTSATLLTGRQQQFSAMITGTTNTAITWSISGGTVSSSGLYTAPSAAGTYTVRAASTADLTKSAQAMVTVILPTPAGSIPSSPAVYWTFDATDVSGNTIYDRSGNGLDLTAYNTTSIPGVVNQALHSNGTNGYAQRRGTAMLDLNTDMTLAAWVRTTNSSRMEAVISKYDAAGIEYGYLLRTTPTGVAELQVGHNNLVSGNRMTTDVTKINDGKWHHLAVVIKLGTSGSITFYVDGMLSSLQSRQFKAGGSSAPLQLGLNPWSPYGNYFTGDLDQVVVYNRTLSASEVAALSAR